MENSYCNCCNHNNYFNYMFCKSMKKKVLLELRQAIWKRKINLWCILVALIIYVVNKSWLIGHLSGWADAFCQCYLNDLVCPLFFLGFSQIMLIWAGHEIESYRYCVLLGGVAGTVWEYLAPLINSMAVSDPIDLICYFIGINIYYICMKLCKKTEV